MTDTTEQQWNTMNEQWKATTEAQKHTAATHRGVVKNQHWAGKWAVAEKRSTDFYGYS